MGQLTDESRQELNSHISGKPTDWEEEKNNLEFCVNVIKDNIKRYSDKLEQLGVDTKELYDNYRVDSEALHSDLGVSMDLMFLDKRTLKKNMAALSKPYFGRIDYIEQDDKKEVKLYIGKNGISRGGSDIVIVDWRAPVASVYYDSDVGESWFLSPLDERIKVYLNLKRTFEIHQSQLYDYYDTDVISNDEFLTKYLGKNKEAVLGEIIATIQKEQNDIIRDTPWHNVVVQGVAGSGKTTVAMHRISYILYNFKEKFHPGEFFIIGSNKMLLKYITGVLPNLDVFGVNQMALFDLMIDLLGRDFDYQKRKYKIKHDFAQSSWERRESYRTELKRKKASLEFVQGLEYFLRIYELSVLMKDTVLFNHLIIFSSDEMKESYESFRDISLQEKTDLLNKRLYSRIKLRLESDGIESKKIKEEVKKYKNYFGKFKQKYDVMEIYDNFINHMIHYPGEYQKEGILIPNADILNLLMSDLTEKQIDLYDLGIMTLIKKRILASDSFDNVGHIIIDEAQDFGVNIFYILKQLFKNCTFTVMGDVTQNIHYDTGMNDWEELNDKVFNPSRDKFYKLAKSYRNTVEISNFASQILKHCSFQTYEIEPIIRHGNPVTLKKLDNEKNMVSEAVKVIKDIQTRGYDTIAVICRSIDETYMVQELLTKYIELKQYMDDVEEMTFTSGIMVLPIHMTKGLEFDSVVLWNPSEVNYKRDDADAKLLYVAATRALHELYVLHYDKLSDLLTK